MNIDHIEAFLYVLHYKNFNKAANALFLSQPTIAARMKSLENELQVTLFNRVGKELELTAKGQEFVPYAKLIVETFQKSKQSMLDNRQQHEVAIGTNIVAAQYFLPFLLPLWHEQFPSIRFKIVSGDTNTIKEKLYDNTVAFAFIGQVMEDGLVSEQLLQNEVVLIAHQQYREHIANVITVDWLVEQPLVFFECGAFDWRYVHKLFEVAKNEPNIVAYVDNLELAKSYILSNQAMGFLPYLCVKKEVENGDLVVISTDHLLQVQQNIFLTYTTLDGLPEAFVKTMRESIWVFT